MPVLSHNFNYGDELLPSAPTPDVLGYWRWDVFLSKT